MKPRVRTIGELTLPVFVGLIGGVLLAQLWMVPLHAAGGANQGTPTPAQTQTAPATQRVFGGDAGLVLNFIKPDKTAEFEGVLMKLKEALQTSPNAQRREQAKSWKVFRAVEPGGGGSVLYLFAIDPAVKGADYTVSTILAEAFPDQVQALYKQYAEAYASGQNFVTLNTVQTLQTDEVPH